MPDSQQQSQQPDVQKQAALAGLLILSPWYRMRLATALATNDIDDYFDTLDDLLEDTGASLSAVLARYGTGRVQSAMQKLIRTSLLNGYQDGANLIGRPPSSLFVFEADKIASARAAEVARQMFATTKDRLKKNPYNSYVLSKQRAITAVRFEAANHYYEGLMRATVNADLEKAWVTTGDDPCPICIENEDAGEIPMGEPFPSGDYAPLAHPNCLCVLEVTGL